MILAPTPELSGELVNIPNGLAGIKRTLAVMRQFVNEGRINPQIRQAATSAVFLTPEKDEYSEIEAIFNYVRDNIRYVKDIHQVETVSSALKTLQGKIGDCDDQTILLAALLESVGYPTRFAVAAYNGNDFEHVYLQAYAYGEFINMDATEHQCMGWEPPGATKIMYEVI
jgi:transglutaminase-like putative cysteine protease